MKLCEICKCPACMFCESDQASLCFSCDERVHTANFLVQKHVRILLCQVCQTPTPWKASGSKFGPTVSVCELCMEAYDRKQEKKNSEDDERMFEENQDLDDEEEDEGEEYDDDEYADSSDEGENQVVPLSFQSPPRASFSSSEEDLSSERFS